MADSPKLDTLLQALVRKVAEIDPSFEVDLVVDPNAGTSTEPIVESIIAAGGTVEASEGDRLRCKVPIAKVSELASQETVSAIRLIRQHRMHRWKS